jgi:hypothetical protein
MLSQNGNYRLEPGANKYQWSNLVDQISLIVLHEVR